MTLGNLPCDLCLLQATKALHGAAWHVQNDQWVTEGDAFGGLPQAAWGRGRRDTEAIYLGVGLSCEVGVL